MPLPLKASKNYLRKSSSALFQKMLVKLTLVASVMKAMNIFQIQRAPHFLANWHLVICHLAKSRGTFIQSLRAFQQKIFL
jgi:hypothetical protein